jgi:hypothetical protein
MNTPTASTSEAAANGPSHQTASRGGQRGVNERVGKRDQVYTCYRSRSTEQGDGHGFAGRGKLLT